MKEQSVMQIVMKVVVQNQVYFSVAQCDVLRRSVQFCGISDHSKGIS